jgi:cob(I)alamin adenosyltransferase
MSPDPKARVLIFTGDGKGKTTAALGMALRASGHEIAVLVVQFVKNDSSCGEIIAAARMPNVQVVQVGMGFLPPAEDERWAEHKAAAQRGLRRAIQAISSGVYPIVVLDELCFAVSRGLIAESEALEAIAAARPPMCLVLTGRGATEGLIAAADTVTEMRSVKHGLECGIAAQRGVEY